MTAPAGINWQDIENGLHDFVNVNTGLVTRWVHEDLIQANQPFCMLSILSGPTREYAAPDEERIEYDGGATEGKEIIQSRHSWQKMTVNIQCFSNSLLPTQSAQYYLTLLHGILHFPMYKTALENAGLTVVRENGITDISDVEADKFVSRASLDIEFRLSLNVIPPADMGTGYIKTAEVTSEVNGVDATLQADDEIMGDL